MTALRPRKVSTLKTANQAFAGLAFSVENAPRRPGLRLEAARPGRFRIVAGEAPILWGRIAPYFAGVSWLREDDRAPIIAPIDTPSTRDAPAATRDEWFAHYAHHFLRELVTSPRSPLDDADWQLCRAIARREPNPGDDLEVVYLDGGIRTEAQGFEPWRTHGSGAVLARRAPSTGDSGRLKSWRKRARDGTLPPALLMYVAPLDMYLILDGHDRLQAALLERITPPMLVLIGVKEIPAREPGSIAALTTEYELQMGRPSLLHPVATRLGQHLAQAYQTHVSHRSRGFALPGGVKRWDAEVEARLGRLAAGTNREMLAP